MALQKVLTIATILAHQAHTYYYTYSEGTPPNCYTGSQRYDNFEDNGFNPITTISVNEGNGYLYSLTVNGITSGTTVQGRQISPCPNYQSGSSFLQTVTLSSTQIITSLNAWSKNTGNGYLLTQIQFVLSDGSTETVTATNFLSSNIMHVYTVPPSPAGLRFIGFELHVYYSWVAYNISCFRV
jgi:hypothetical protein